MEVLEFDGVHTACQHQHSLGKGAHHGAPIRTLNSPSRTHTQGVTGAAAPLGCARSRRRAHTNAHLTP